MKKIAIVLLSVLMLSGCINITEEIFFESNGSGKYKMTMDLEKAMEMMDMLKAFAPDSAGADNKEMGPGMLDSLKQNFNAFDSVPGITQVTKEQEGNKLIVSFHFRDIKALNDAMKKRNKKDAMQQDLYTFSPGNFSFADTTMFGMGDAMKDLESGNKDSVAASMEMVKALIGDMNYTTIYHFPGKVQDFSNKSATLDADGKTVKLTVNLLEQDKKNTLQNTIRFKK